MKIVTVALVLVLALTSCAAMKTLENKTPTQEETARDLEMEDQTNPPDWGM